jgi:hypothetical protein
MAKASDEDRVQYLKKIKSYQAMINTIQKGEGKLLEEIQQEGEGAVLKRISLVDTILNLTSYYIILNSISQAILKVNNEDALNEARKSINKGLLYLEGMVTGLVDAPFSEYEDKVAILEPVNAEKRYHLVRKMGLAIQLLENSLYDFSKWKWSFVDVEGRFAALAKNILDMKNVVANTDPRSLYYEATVYHLKLVKKLLNDVADRYRERYEQSSNHSNDFQAGLNFIYALRRIHILLGESYEAETVKRKIDVWEAKFQGDLNKKQEEKNAEKEES